MAEESIELPDEIKKVLADMRNWSLDSEDEPICQKCKKRVTNGIPLRMWRIHKEETYEISFHIKCVWPNAVTGEDEDEED